jgi:hypothetical protein
VNALHELAPMTHTKALRATRWQRLVFRLRGRWPQSYVDARLAAADRDAAEIREKLEQMTYVAPISVAPPRQVFEDWT